MPALYIILCVGIINVNIFSDCTSLVIFAHRLPKRAIQVLRNAVWGIGGVNFPRKKSYEGVWFYVISVTRGWVGVKFPGEKRYVALEWPQKVT